MSDDKPVPKIQKKFSPTEICRIIKACKKNEVSELKVGELEVRFHEKVKLQEITTFPSRSKRKTDQPETMQEFVTTSKPAVESVEEEENYSEHSIRTLQELAIAQLLIDDPTAFEAEEIDAALEIEGS